MKNKLLLLLGVSSLALASPARADLVVNGGFETGDFTGWTLFGNPGYRDVDTTFSGVAPAVGNYQADFGAIGSIGGIEQTLTTTPGQAYELSYWLYNFGGTPSEIQIGWGGTTITDMLNPSAFGYTEFTDTVVANGPTEVLSLGFRQDPSFFLLDNVMLDGVTVVPAPEPAQLASSLLVAGLGSLGLVARRRWSRN